MSDRPALVHDRITARRFCCGPLDVTLQTQDGYLCSKIAETLELYDFTWPPPRRPVTIFARRSNTFVPAASGNFLRCARMLVDTTDEGLRASTTSGVRASARFDNVGETWHVTVSDDLVNSRKLEEIEDVLSLVLTSGWRRDGWTPIHGAAVVKGEQCLIICAPTGGGKTTLSAALVRRGWRVLGDDKLLLRMQGSRPLVAALLHTFNLHPKSRVWFPEVGDLEVLPRYSVWTEKRKVSVSSIWSHAPAKRAEPSVLIALQRRVDATEPLIASLEHRDILATLLRQTVIPCDPATARAIVSTVANASAHLRGLRIEVPTDAYRNPQFLRALEHVLETPR